MYSTLTWLYSFTCFWSPMGLLWGERWQTDKQTSGSDLSKWMKVFYYHLWMLHWSRRAYPSLDQNGIWPTETLWHVLLCCVPLSCSPLFCLCCWPVLLSFPAQDVDNTYMHKVDLGSKADSLIQHIQFLRALFDVVRNILSPFYIQGDVLLNFFLNFILFFT